MVGIAKVFKEIRTVHDEGAPTMCLNVSLGYHTVSKTVRIYTYHMIPYSKRGRTIRRLFKSHHYDGFGKRGAAGQF